MSPRPRRDAGQASLEYVALLGVVAAVLLISATLAVGAPRIVNAVVRELQHALCIVTGGRCSVEERHACAVDERRLDAAVSATVVVTLGRHLLLARRAYSDGTIELTLVHDDRIGVATGQAVGGHLDVGDWHVGGGAGTSLEALIRLGGATTWRVRSTAAADALQRDLAEVATGEALRSPVGPDVSGWVLHHLLHLGSGRRLPDPVDVTSSQSLEGSGAAELGGFTLSGDVVVGRTHHRSGGTTWSLSLGGTAGFSLGAGVKHPSAEAAGDALGVGAGGQAELSVTTDADGHLTDLVLTRTADGSLAGLLAPGGGGSGRIELTERLDLTQPANAAVAGRLLATLRPDRAGGLPGALADLERQIADRGRLDAATYATDETAYGGGGVVALEGLAVGVDGQETSSSSHLLQAWTRPEGGLWEERTDCERR